MWPFRMTLSTKTSATLVELLWRRLFTTLSPGVLKSCQQQNKPLQRVKSNAADFHTHSVKSFISIRWHQSLLRFYTRQPTSNPRCKRPEHSNSERRQKKITKSSKDVNPITAFKWQGTLSPSPYFTGSLPSAHCRWQEQPEGPVALAAFMEESTSVGLRGGLGLVCVDCPIKHSQIKKRCALRKF